MEITKVNTVSCPHCGAPIRIRKYEINVKCEYCGSLYEAKDEEIPIDIPKNANKMQLAANLLDYLSKNMEKSAIQESYKKEEKEKELKNSFIGMNSRQIIIERIRRYIASASSTDLFFIGLVISIFALALLVGLFDMIFS